MKELRRLVDDFVFATGRQLQLEMAASDAFDIVVVTLDGRAKWSFGHAFPREAEELLADVAGSLQELLSQEVWGGWPICSIHQSHPLEARVVEGIATWVCPKGEIRAVVGQLSRY